MTIWKNVILNSIWANNCKPKQLFCFVSVIFKNISYLFIFLCYLYFCVCHLIFDKWIFNNCWMQSAFCFPKLLFSLWLKSFKIKTKIWMSYAFISWLHNLVRLCLPFPWITSNNLWVFLLVLCSIQGEDNNKVHNLWK